VKTFAFRLTILLALLLICTKVFAGSARKSIVAIRTPTPPKIDGFLSDKVWSLAPPTSSFTQFDPVEGAAPTESTSVRALYDDNAIYFGIMMYDSKPKRIVRQLTRRDRSSEADRISITIDSYNDRLTGFNFSVNASGVQTDGIISSDGVIYDTNWDAVWESATKVLRTGWSAEVKIPFSALRFPPRKKYTWGINFRRYISRKKETDEWVMIPHGQTGLVSKIGNVTGIADITPPAYLEILPYALCRQMYQPTAAMEREKKKLEGGMGLDLRYGLTSTATVNATFNPDFGQVEADQAILNLTSFETFYPEKRPFFFEGSQIFDFGTAFDGAGMRLFYSRRIGLQPDYQPTDGEKVLSLPKNTTILGAGKLTAHTASGLTVGVLEAVTDEEHATVATSTGSIEERLAAPLSNFLVARLKKTVLENSSVGAMLTSVNRRGLLPAQSGGVDWSLRFADNTYALDGYLAFSRSSLNSVDRVTGTAARLYLGKIAGNHWVYATTYDYTSRQYNINDVGFLLRPNDHGGYSQVQYQELAAPGILRRYYLRLAADYRWNFDNINLTKNFEFNPVFELKNFWTLSASFQRNFSVYDDRETRGRGLYEHPSEVQLKFDVSTDPRPKAVGTYSATFLSTAKGGKIFLATADITFRPVTWTEMSANLLFGSTINEEAWVNPYGNILPDTTVFGSRETKQYSATVGGTITFTRDLTLQIYGQLFLAKGHYDAFRRLVSPSKFVDFDSEFRSRLMAQGLSADFNQHVFNANIVLRWEYLPGSTIYLVWTQARNGLDHQFFNSFSENLSDSFRLPADNLFLLKINYWWSL
jgi:hypothetical protein